MKKDYTKLKRDYTKLEGNVACEYAGNKTYKEIAAALGISVKAVDNALIRIRKKAREEFHKSKAEYHDPSSRY